MSYNIVGQQPQRKFELDAGQDPDYCVVELLVRDEVGSLAKALEGFLVSLNYSR